jgi:hypothetical protein
MGEGERLWLHYRLGETTLESYRTCRLPSLTTCADVPTQDLTFIPQCTCALPIQPQNLAVL